MRHFLRLWTQLTLILVVLLLSTHSFAADDGIGDISIISIPSSAGQSVSHELSFVATRELTSAQVRVEYPYDFHLFLAKLPSLSYRSGQSLVFSVPRVISAGERVVLRADNIITPTTPGTYNLAVFTGAGTTKIVRIPLLIKGADGAVTVAWLDATSLLPNRASSHTLNFLATSGLAAGGTITVQYPSGFGLSGATVPSNQDFTLQEVSGQTIIYRVSRSYLPGQVVAVVTDGIINPIISGTHFLKVSTSSDPTVISIPHLVRPGGNVGSVYLKVSGSTAGQTSSYTLNFDPTTGLPEGSTVTLEFPEGFTPAVDNSASNQYTVENVSGQTVTLRMLRGARAYVYHRPRILTIMAEPGEVAITMSNVVNPLEAGTYYFKLWTSNDPDKVVLPVFITTPLLSISFAGSGRGSINGGYSCQAPDICSFNTTLPRVTLIPTPDADSVFAGWSGACTGTHDNCDVVMGSNRYVTAIFNLADKVRVSGRPHSTLAAAFAEAASGTVEARATGFTENLTVTRPTSFKGGFNNLFTSNSGGFTVLNGTLAVGAGGRLLTESLVIR